MTLPTRKIFTLCVLLAVLLALQGRAAPAEADGVTIAVLISHDRAPYGDALAGFKDYLAQQKLNVTYAIYDLGGDTAQAARTVERVREAAPRLVFALGSLALREAAREIRDIPIVAGMILDEKDLHGFANATGVHLAFPYEVQFTWLQRILPGARKVGVVYNPAENRVNIKEAARAARQMGLELVPQEVSVPQELPASLKNLDNSVDVLWGVSDHVVLTPQTAKDLLLFSFRNRIPFVGLSEAWVKAGALYALDRDYHDVGRQCGEIAFRVLHGETVGAIPPAPPRTVTYSLNEKTARRMKVSFPEALLRGAAQIY